MMCCCEAVSPHVWFTDVSGDNVTFTDVPLTSLHVSNSLTHTRFCLQLLCAMWD